MGKRRVLGLTAVAVGAAAAGNRLVNRRVEPLGPPLGRETGSYRWRGMDVAFTEAGDPEDPDMVLLHGIDPAATSREFRRIFDELAEDYHVLAPEFPGFGRSDRPALTYSAALYESLVRDFVRELTDDPICLARGLAGAYALAAAEETNMGPLVLVCPTTTDPSAGHRFRGALLRTPVLGTGGYNLLTSTRLLSYSLRRHALFDPNVLDREDREYLWQTAHQPRARYATASLLSGYLDAAIDLEAAIAERGTTTTLIWGREVTAPSLSTGRELAASADAKLVVIDRSRTLPHFEQPRSFLEVLTEELAVPDRT